ncbi:MAG: cytochrome c [Usitatibacter sp.]
MRPALAFLAASLCAHAADGSVDEGRKLVAQHRCEACHEAKTLGDAKAIYLRKDRKVTSLAKLKSQVALCNSELNLQLFPDEEEHVAAFLDHTYYRFEAK